MPKAKLLQNQPNKCVVPLRLSRLAGADGKVKRSEYGVTYITAGLVRLRSGGESNWRILPAALEPAAPMFSGVGMQVDHASLATLFYPSLRDTAGVTFNANWNEESQSIEGGARLYQRDDLVWLRQFLDELLQDQEAGREVPDIGLSAVLWHNSEVVELDNDEEEMQTQEVTHVESVDFVFGPGAEGRLRDALASLNLSHFMLERPPERPADDDCPGERPGERPDEGAANIVDDRERSLIQAERAREQINELDIVQQGGLPMDEQLNTPQQVAVQQVGVQDAAQNVGQDAAQLALGSEAQVQAVQEGSEPEPEQPPQARPEQPAEVADGNGRLGQIEQQLEEQNSTLQRLNSYLAEQAEANAVHGMGQAPREQITVGRSGLEQVEAAFEAMMAGVLPPPDVQPLTGIREFYHLLSGDYEMTGLFNTDRVMLANVNSSTMAGLVANALNKRVVNMFQAYPKWWEPAVIPEDFTSLQDVRWITLGGFGELPTVPEGGAYNELTWDDQTETNPFVKKGGYVNITLEAIDKDDTRRLLAAPQALAQSAWLTLSKDISSIFTSNSGVGPTMSDGVALFHSNHNNVSTGAFSPANWRATKIAMMKQTELNSGERLGALTKPALVWVPTDLEDYAVEVLGSEGKADTANNNVNVDADGESRSARLDSARRRVISCPLWTDTNSWAAQADPNLYPSIGMGYRYGRTPEIFSVASPTAGLMFSNDTLPIKIRFFYAVGPTDWRGLYKNNVP